MSAGSCTVGLSITIQIGNDFVKPNISFEESYTGVGNDTRENKFNELLEQVKEKLLVVAKESSTLMETAKNKPRKYKVSLSEDDF